MAKHFVAYHNQDKMGRSLTEGDPLHVVSNSKLQRLQNNIVWMIVGESVQGSPRKRFTLGSVFVVNEHGDTREEAFRHFARGVGHRFDPPPDITNEPWFQDLQKKTFNFRGISEIKEEAIIAALGELAVANGYQLPA